MKLSRRTVIPALAGSVLAGSAGAQPVPPGGNE